jgi:hypothetical protein
MRRVWLRQRLELRASQGAGDVVAVEQVAIETRHHLRGHVVANRPQRNDEADAQAGVVLIQLTGH